MANIKKNFNFRNGVQVDDDNLLVTTTGLVGIGTTVPTESLDVRGNVKVIGDFTATNSVVGVLTITEASPTRIIGAGVSIKSGIVTAQGTGIVTFFGDARFLQGMPTSQWEDTNAGLGVSSIYNTGGTVGIGTTSPQFTLQIGGNTNPEIGVGISSSGDIKATGIVTASTFSGNVVGNVTGNITGNVTGNLNSLGVSTVADLRVTDLNVDGHTNLDNVNIVGLTTFVNSGGNAGLRVRSFAAGTFAAGEMRVLETPDQSIVNGGPMIQLFTNKTPAPLNGPGDREEISFYTSLQAGAFLQDGSLQLNKNFNVAGVTTLTGITSFFGDVFFPEKIEGSTGFERLNGVKYNSSSASLEFNGFADATFGADETFGRKLKLFSTTGSGGTLSKTAGSFTIIRALNTSLGIQCGVSSQITLGGHNGDTIIRISPSPVGVATIRNADISQQLTAINANITGIVTAAELNSPLIGVGTDAPANPIQVRSSGNTEIQVTSDTGSAGLTVGREPSTDNTNNAEFRYGGGAGAPYSTAQSLDLLNYGSGNFNYYIGANNPNAVAGDFHWHKGVNSARLMTLTNTGRLGIGITNPGERLTVAGVCTVTSNSFVGGNLNVSGNSTIGGNVTINGSLIIPVINTNIIGNVTGDLSGNVFATSGISTFKTIGINTTETLPSVDLDCLRANATFKRVGIGSTQPDGVLDASALLSEASKRFIMLPKVSAGSTAVIQADSPEGGGLIYNTTLRKLQFFNGTNWETVTSVEVTG